MEDARHISEILEDILSELKEINKNDCSKSKIEEKPDRVIRMSDVARMLNKHQSTIGYYVKKGRLHIVKQGGIKGIRESELKEIS